MQKLILLLTLVSLFSISRGSAQQVQGNPNIYLIKAFACANQPKDRTLTGFHLQGLNGIVTALHGVADAGTITATSDRGQVYRNLKVTRVDAANDVALLSSDTLKFKTVEGLAPAKNVRWSELSTAQVEGHPFGIKNLNTTLHIRRPALRVLSDLVELEPLRLLIKRGSPSPSIQVVSIEGQILPGHSGAPLLDSYNRVVAVANGGLRGGYAGVSWAIPLDKIKWSAAGRQNLAQFAKQPVNELFEYGDADTVKLDKLLTLEHQRHPLDPTDMRIKLRVPLSSIKFADYTTRLSKVFTQAARDYKEAEVFELRWRKGELDLDQAIRVTQAFTGKYGTLFPNHINFDPNYSDMPSVLFLDSSPSFLPDKTAEKFVEDTLKAIPVQVDVYAAPISERVYAKTASRPLPDMRLTFWIGIDDIRKPPDPNYLNRYLVSYNPKDNTMLFESDSIEKFQFVYNTNQIKVRSDFFAAQFFMTVGRFGAGQNESKLALKDSELIGMAFVWDYFDRDLNPFVEFGLNELTMEEHSFKKFTDDTNNIVFGYRRNTH